MTDMDKQIDNSKPSVVRQMTNAVADFPVIGKIIKPRNKVAVIRLSGVIADQGKKGTISFHKYAPLIKKAFAIADLNEVALVINSPGGAPAQCSLISSMIRNLSEEKNIPVTAFIEDVAASLEVQILLRAPSRERTARQIVGYHGFGLGATPYRWQFWHTAAGCF